VDELTSLIDALDKLVAEAPSSWFLRNRVRLKRKEAVALVEKIGVALDAHRSPSRDEQGQDVVRILLTESFKNLDHVVRQSGGGGPAYQMRYLDIDRQRMSASVGSFRADTERAFATGALSAAVLMPPP
jgi:hypothetical protein